MRDIQDIGKAPEDSFEMVHSELLDEIEAINNEIQDHSILQRP